MNNEPASTDVVETQLSRASPSVNLRVLIRFLIFALLYPAALFLAAWTFKWAWGWAYYAILALSTIIGRALVLRRHPELLAERASYRTKEDAKPWDRVLVRIVALYGPVLTWITAGLDHRWQWSPDIRPSLQGFGLAIVLLGTVFSNWALVVNRFFSAIVRIQHDRGHEVVRDGPYRVVRHPGYAGGLYVWLTTPLMLGSLWAYIPALLTACAIVVRTALEDRTLIAELAGYDEYAHSTRYRLLPGIW
jgi:protein-S-isoprenylcysteine O-methyltransferase Ste14